MVAAWTAAFGAAIVFAGLPARAEVDHSPRIVVIQSYHPGYDWGDYILEGLEGALGAQRADVSVEYLDTHRNDGPAYEAALDGLLEAKYAHDPAPAVVIACDNPALDFVLARRDGLFKSAPVVFCGVNGFSDEMLRGQRGITGVVEAADFKGTIQMALRLGPGVTRVCAVGVGRGATREANLASLRRLKGEFGSQLDLETLDGIKRSDLPAALEALPRNVAILLYYHLTDELGHVQPLSETIAVLDAHAQGPVYSCWDFTIEHGALGGRVVSGREQGRAAARLALRILEGEAADNIPIIRESPNVNMFNYAQLRRFGLRKRDLPRGAMIVGEPVSFYREHWEWFWVGSGALLIQGVTIGILLVNRARLHRAQRAVLESEAKYRSLAEQSHDGIMIVQDECVRYLNGRMAELIGRNADDVLDQPMQSIVDEDSAAHAAAMCRRHLTGESDAAIFECKLRGRDSQTLEVECSSCAIQFRGRRAVLATIRDISQRRREEVERQLLQARIEQSQRLESLGVLAGGIAHDFNNLLVGILGHVELAGDRVTHDPMLRSSLNAIETAARRAADLTKQMLAYAGRGRFLIEPVDVNSIVHETLRLLRPATWHSVRVELELGSQLPSIFADASQVRQVVLNLLTNAVEAIGAGPGTIRVCTEVRECDRDTLCSAYVNDDLSAEPYLVLSVADSGCGMDDATKRRIFEPFFTTKFTGRGLGLAATLGIVRGHRGALQVVSEKGAGATFSAFFPLAGATAPPPQTAPKPGPGSQTGGSQRGTVLLVDDEDLVRETCTRTLQHLGLHVIAADSGQRALEILRERAEQIDCVFLDLVMPQMNGQETLAALRTIRSDMPVVVVSGISDKEASDRLASLRVDGVIQKPYRVADVRTVLARVLGWSNPEAASTPTARE